MKLPFSRAKREYESHLSEFRVDAGLTVRELCEKTGVLPNMYVGLNSGVIAPIYITGELREDALLLSAYLGHSLAEIWPRYFCDIEKPHEFSDDEVIRKWHRGCLDSSFRDPAEIIEEKEMFKAFLACLNDRLTKSELWVFLKITFEELTLADIGKEMGLTRARVQQIHKEAISKLNNKWGQHPIGLINNGESPNKVVGSIVIKQPPVKRDLSPEEREKEREEAKYKKRVAREVAAARGILTRERYLVRSMQKSEGVRHECLKHLISKEQHFKKYSREYAVKALCARYIEPLTVSTVHDIRDAVDIFMRAPSIKQDHG